MDATFDEIRRRTGDPDFALIDVLPRESFLEGHIPGARSLPLEDLSACAAEVIPELDADVVAYCGSPTCPRAVQAVGLLQGLGYARVRHYPGGLAGWKESGGRLEPGTGETVVAPRRVAPSSRSRWTDRIIDLAGTASFGALLTSWLGMVLAFGVVYWILGVMGGGALQERGAPVRVDLHGFWTSIYFSFVTATSIGFGDVVPVGTTRVFALIEASTKLLLFGTVVSKLVSRRQELLMEEIHRIAFEDRLGRVRTNLHLVLADLQSVASDFDRGGVAEDRMLGRIESAAMVFTGELRAIHDLLYRPQQDPEAEVLESILAGVAAGLSELQTLLSRFPAAAPRSPMLRSNLGAMRRFAGEICGECVPRSYAVHLKVWMDRVQVLAHGLPGAGSATVPGARA